LADISLQRRRAGSPPVRSDYTGGLQDREGSSNTASAPTCCSAGSPLLLTRLVETKTGRSWAAVRADLCDLHVGVFTGPAGTFTQTGIPTTAALGIAPPKKILQLTPAN
jgi:hypothetical protein